MHNTLTAVLVVVLFCVLLTCKSADADFLKATPLLLPVKNSTIISVSQTGKKIVARLGSGKNSRSIKISTKLASELLGSDETRLLLDASTVKRNLYVVLSRKPSNSKNRTGYCGAGHEDILLLINVTKNEVNLVDTFLLQSCITLKTLYSKNGDDTLSNPLKGLTIDNENRFINFEWVKDEQGYIWTLYIENNQFLLR